VAIATGFQGSVYVGQGASRLELSISTTMWDARSTVLGLGPAADGILSDAKAMVVSLIDGIIAYITQPFFDTVGPHVMQLYNDLNNLQSELDMIIGNGTLINQNTELMASNSSALSSSWVTFPFFSLCFFYFLIFVFSFSPSLSLFSFFLLFLPFPFF